MSAIAILSLLDAAGFSLLRLLLTVLWQSTILLAACGGLAFFLRHRKESVRHALWVGALLLLPLLPVLSWTVSTIGAPRREIPVMPVYEPMQDKAYTPLIRPMNGDTQSSAIPPQSVQSAPLRLSPWAAALIIYAGVVLFLLTAILAGRLRVRRWILEGEAVIDDRTLAIFDRAREHLSLRREVTVLESDKATVPFAIHTFRPVVLLPNGFAARLTDPKLASVAAHELAHIRRHDPLTLTLVSLIRAVFFFQPLVWFAAREAGYLAECACDSAALELTGEARSYAGLISRLAEELPRRTMSPEYAAGLVFSRSVFLKRVETILSDKRKSMKRFTGLALAGTLAAAIISLAAALSCGPGESKHSSAPAPHDIQGISFVSIPGGTFQMGNVENAPEGRSEEKPVHTVTVSSFDMSVCEITNAQYAKYLNEALASGDVKVITEGVKGAQGEFSGQVFLQFSFGPDVNNECWISFKNGTFMVASGRETWPVVYVTWYGAKAFALHYGMDLPTEAEWEYACRGGRQYMYGTVDGTINRKKANYTVNIPHPVDVGSYPKNPFGLCDMSGNVNEWCLDLFGKYPPESVTNPSGPQSGNKRVMRGGSWDGYGGARYCRAAFRFSGIPPDMRSNGLGFRVVHRSGTLPDKKTAGADTLLPESRIEGRVISDHTGKPLEGIRVVAYGPANWFRGGRETTTDKDGRYSIGKTRLGIYYLSFTVWPVRRGELPDYAPARVDSITMRLGEEVIVDVRLVRGGIITGRVTMGDTGKPVVGVRVGENDAKALVAVTDSHGVYRMRASPGPARVYVSEPVPDGYAPETPSASVTVRAGKTVEGVDFAFRKITAVSGKILSPKGAPVSGANVWVTRHVLVHDGTFANVAGKGGMSKSDGSVVLPDMVEGEAATLDVEMGSAGLRGKLEFTPRTGKGMVSRDEFVIRLERFALHDLEGRIVDEKGAPVDMAKVTFTPNLGETNSGAYSNSAGKFRLVGLETGKNYRITITAKGYEKRVRELSPFSGDMTDVKDIVLKKSPKVL